MISANLIGQFGNQAMIYVTAKIIAEQTKMAYTPPKDFVDKSGRQVVWNNGSPLFVMEPTAGSVVKGAVKVIAGPNYISPKEVSNTNPIRLVGGYYQRYEFLRPYKDKIVNEWMRIRKPFVPTDPSAVYIHCRRTDYVVERTKRQQACGSPAANSIEEYAECLKKFPEARRIVVATDNLRDPFLYEFHRLGLPWEISGGTWDQDFLMLASARWMIMSQSTYSWWAALLGRCEHIVCPMAKNSTWYFGMDAVGPKKPYCVNLVVDDEERWEWLVL